MAADEAGRDLAFQDVWGEEVVDDPAAVWALGDADIAADVNEIEKLECLSEELLSLFLHHR